MSIDDQHDLSEFQTAEKIKSDGYEVPNWEPKSDEDPDTGARVECELCDASVSKKFAKVFGDNDDRVINGCPSCSTYREISGRGECYGTGNGPRGDGW